MTSTDISRVNGLTPVRVANGANGANHVNGAIGAGVIHHVVIAPRGPEPDRRAADAALDEGVLSAVGVGPAEERAYVTLLEQQGLTAAELAALIGTSPRHADDLLAALEDRAMVSRTPDTPARWLPVSPDVAVGALVAAQESKLHRARLAAERLREVAYHAAARRPAANDLVEVIAGREAIVQRFHQLQAATEVEVLSFDCPPYVHTVALNQAEFEALARGVAYRAVYDRAALEYPGGVDHIRRYVQAGEQARIFSPAPMKLAVFDRRVALVPQLDPSGLEITSALLLRSSTLLDALVELFEHVWQRAVPLALGAGPTSMAALQDIDVIALLAAGLKDGAIARKLAVSTRTLDRRISALMAHLDARTRFQAGYTAGYQTGLRAGCEAGCPGTESRTPHVADNRHGEHPPAETLAVPGDAGSP